MLLLLVSLTLSRSALAADDVPPPPPEFGTKRRLSDDDYRDKRENGYFTGLPLLNYDPNTGFGGGAGAYYYLNGKRTDPLFAYTPYQHRFFLQAFVTTLGYQSHLLDYDAPTLFDSPWRLRAQVNYERNNSQNYFGIGEGARALSFPGAQRTFSDFARYQEALDRVTPNGTTYARYNKFELTRPQGLVSVERSLLGGLFRSFFGFGFSYADVVDLTGTRTDGVTAGGQDITVRSARTRLRDDCDTHRIVGCQGGWENRLRLALVFDTRDFEPDPNSGIFSELAADFGTSWLGSQYEFARVMLAMRGYWSPIPRQADLVLAARGIYEVQSQGVPFFSLNTFPFTEDVRAGLGGLRSLRGFRENRFVGHVMALTNYEVRWTFAKTTILGERFGFMAVPFVDMGRVFDSVRRTSLADWERTQGLGLRIAWNLATIVMIDYGFSNEDSGLYLNFSHIF